MMRADGYLHVGNRFRECLEALFEGSNGLALGLWKPAAKRSVRIHEPAVILTSDAYVSGRIET
jgi:hypothetical protein